MISRRQAARALVSLFGAAPFLHSEGPIPSDPAAIDWNDPLYGPVSVMDFAAVAKTKLDPLAWDYLEGGSEDELTLRENLSAYGNWIIRPRMLTDVHKIDTSLELLGAKLDYPILLDPAGGKNCFHQAGELAVSRAAANARALHITNGGIDDLIDSGAAPTFWQLTTGGQLLNAATMRAFVKRLEAQGCRGICFTVDIMHVSKREREMRNKLERSWCETGIPARGGTGRLPVAKNPWRAGIWPSRPQPTPTWDTLSELCAMTKLPVIVKGIMTAEDGDRCVKHGAKAVIVSNHGARQLDQVGATIEALPEVVAAVSGRIPVLLDGGIRRGTDVLKALAIGAKAVCVARPYLYGLTAFGERGVERVLQILKSELALSMGLAGVANLAAIDPSLVRRKTR
ncbi:MAG: alpha-hydroxy-acid oxidizing protein [Bryobacterales bacterium]|nr:alpha-hydroxy-acid oxidizing protein [Bryobacterales bacterium]